MHWYYVCVNIPANNFSSIIIASDRLSERDRTSADVFTNVGIFRVYSKFCIMLVAENAKMTLKIPGTGARMLLT